MTDILSVLVAVTPLVLVTISFVFDGVTVIPENVTVHVDECVADAASVFVSDNLSVLVRFFITNLVFVVVAVPKDTVAVAVNDTLDIDGITVRVTVGTDDEIEFEGCDVEDVTEVENDTVPDAVAVTVGHRPPFCTGIGFE